MKWQWNLILFFFSLSSWVTDVACDTEPNEKLRNDRSVRSVSLAVACAVIRYSTRNSLVRRSLFSFFFSFFLFFHCCYCCRCRCHCQSCVVSIESCVVCAQHLAKEERKMCSRFNFVTIHTIRFAIFSYLRSTSSLFLNYFLFERGETDEKNETFQHREQTVYFCL